MINEDSALTFDLKTEFPGFTVWEDKKCCCAHSIYIPSIEKYFLGSWEISCKYPFISLSTLLSTYIFGMIYIFHSVHFFTFKPLFFTALFLFATCSYLKVIIDGPGYLPFYWNLDSLPANQNDLTLQSELVFNPKPNGCPPDGIISNERQFSWAHYFPRPNRCILSSIGRRIVLRPDHYCSWVSSWIGQRNHKFFFLFLFWTFQYVIYYAYVAIDQLITNSQQTNFEFTIFFFIIISTILVAFIFVVYIGYFLFQQILMISKNVTNWEKWNNIDSKRFDKGGVIKNFEDVFGPRSLWFLWLLPISPWKTLTNDDILSTYLKPYKDV